MASDSQSKARAYYRIFSRYEELVAKKNEQKHYVVKDFEAEPILAELVRLEHDLPGLIPPFGVGRQTNSMTGENFYPIVGFQAHLASVLGRLETASEPPASESTPVTEEREFRSIRNRKLRAILERDYSEIQRAFVAQCWKSVIILSGGALETILLDLVEQNETKAKVSPAAPKEPDITRWTLSQLIDVCVDCNLAPAYTSSVSAASRQYRNLVHPGVEIRNKLVFGKAEAQIAVAVLDLVSKRK